MRAFCKASAPGKAILFGEHFVVYGEPAIAVALNIRVKVTAYKSQSKFIEGFRTALVNKAIDAALKTVNSEDKNVHVKIESDLPVSVGLGSSAATASAIIAAVTGLFGVKLSKDELFNMALECEKTVHVNPSGIDPAVTVNGGAVLYQRGVGIKPVKLGEDFTLIIGNTGEGRSTGAMVEKVRIFAERRRDVMDGLRKTYSSTVLRALEALEKGDFEELGLLMNVNHGLLEALGVSNFKLNKLVYASREAGALGAKLTGGGGGGCMIALASKERLKSIAEVIMRAGGEPIIAPISKVGVVYEG
ncbi:mevalonate kinase [Candidatus Bathyarchaeota archaeon]|nr:mevalonate kinase [Candidatus Bathyarchaeota archaeon]MBS7617543.1 mevalonate kinase [Candidatus Bathyarchaeota archaeon]